jgi:hypothetical protein
MDAPRYRSDIDGLRAVSIILVVGFHTFPQWFHGGFIGVDIFFVISGFLISFILLHALSQGTFSYTAFFSHRIRRIFPALLIVLVACLLYGKCLYVFQREQLAKHVIAGALFLLNFMSQQESGYFDTPSALQPLLPLWSLGIEGQFYLLWPALLVATYKTRQKPLLLIAALCLLSFDLNFLLIDSHPTETFFLPYSRFWELLIGALLAYCTLFNPDLAKRLKTNLTAYLGAVLIGLAVILITTETAFPGGWALLPAIGAALLIASGPHSRINRVLLANRPMVFLGRISYPLYLWHWPILSFIKIRYGTQLNADMRLLVIGASLLLAWLTYIGIEGPVRRKTIPTQFLLFVWAVTISYCFWSISDKDTSQNENNRFVQFIHDNAFAYNAALARNGKCNFHERLLRASKNTIDPSCYIPLPSQTVRIFLWGDSHAAQLWYGLSKTLSPSIAILETTSNLCPQSLHTLTHIITAEFLHSCNISNDFALQRIAELKPDIVIMAQWRYHETIDWNAIATDLHNKGVKHVILMGPVPEWDPLLYLTLARYWPNPPLRVRANLTQNTEEILRVRYHNSSILTYVSVFDKWCNKEGCLAYVNNDKVAGLMSFDYGHLTPDSSVLLAQNILVPRINQILSMPEK